MNKPFEPQLNTKPDTLDIPIKTLPCLYRIGYLEKKESRDQTTFNIAHLYHDKASLSVAWVSREHDERLSVGTLVTPRWYSQSISNDGQIIIDRLLPVETPITNVNVFETIPYEWLNNRSMIEELKLLIDFLPEYFKHLLNAIFWDKQRFFRFVTGPSSLNGHHHYKHGNLIHTVEVTKNALSLLDSRQLVYAPVLLMAALLHDAAKADEYEFNPKRNAFQMSTRGVLIGHKLSIIEWIAAAVAKYQIEIPTEVYLSLIHTLTAVKGAPDWMGLRSPVSLECHLLSAADRLSSEGDLFEQLKPGKNGFGRFHKHLRGRPYFVNY
jgi:3'-5' exoribonuclease